jgi:glycine cleavage system H protein
MAMVKIEGNEFPEDIYYHREHMWAKVEEGKVRVGYNEWAQEAAGKLVNLNTRRVGRNVRAGKAIGTVESGKWVGPLKSPISGKILEINEKVLKKPSLINEDPYGEGWIAIIDPTNLGEELEELIKGSDQIELDTWLREEKAKHNV